MDIIAYTALAAAVMCGVLRCVSRKYVFSALTSVFCACAVAASGDMVQKLTLIAGLLVSVVADWYLAHQAGHPNRFLYGVIGFFMAHCLFGAYACVRFAFNVPAAVVAGVLLIVYSVYMAKRMLPHVDGGLKLPLVMYMLVSIASLYFAMSMNAPLWEKTAYVAGIAAILFSDTMIGENEFVGVKAAGALVLPTYYLCHALIALSAILR